MILKADKIGETKALLVGKELSFIRNILEEKLENKGCKVYKKAESLFDYIVFFGNFKKKNLLSKNLKPGGKILLITTKKEEKKYPFPVFVIDLAQPTTSDDIADKILRKLFLQSPFFPAKKKEKKIKKANFVIFKKPALILTYFILITSPVWFFLMMLFYGVSELKTIADQKTPLVEKEKRVERGVIALDFSRRTGLVFKDIISIFSKKEGEAFKAALDILEILSAGANEIISLEKIIAYEDKSLFAGAQSLSIDKALQVKTVLSRLEKNLTNIEVLETKIESYKNYSSFKKPLAYLEKIISLRPMIGKFSKFMDIFPEVLGFEKEKKYLLLFQNNFELRPTGGFIGSYGVLKLNQGKITDFKIEDVYSADGQLKGRVMPPLALEKILNQPNWFLRDSNWDPDFSASANQAEWFLQKETGEKFDGVFAIDLYFISSLLESLGEVYVPDYQAKVTASDFFLKLQSETHQDFFAGSTKKKDLLSSLASSLLIAFEERKDISPTLLVRNIYQSLEEKDFLINLHHKNSQKTVEELGWGGRILSTDEKNADYFMMIEANLGVNKVNYNIARNIAFDIFLTDQYLEKKATLKFENKSSSEITLTDGLYKNYLRLILPELTNISSLKINGKTQDLRENTELVNYNDKTILGFLVEVLPGEKSLVQLQYRIPVQLTPPRFNYQFLIQKQPGIESLPITIAVREDSLWKTEEKDQFLSQNLRQDEVFTIDFVR